MALTVINKQFFRLERAPSLKMYVTLDKDGLYFTKEALEYFWLTPGSFIHFLNDGRMWAFICNSDPDGFKITKNQKEGGVRICSRELAQMIRRSTGVPTHEKLTMFHLESSPCYHQNSPVIQLINPPRNNNNNG